MAEKKPFMMVVLGDFNAKSESWYTNDSTNIGGSKINFLSSSFGFHQIINNPTHILNNSSSRINSIFATEPNLVIKSGVHSSLHANCHHQLPYVKFNLNVFYPPSYGREVWHYKFANSDCFKGQLKILIEKRHFSMLMLTKSVTF